MNAMIRRLLPGLIFILLLAAACADTPEETPPTAVPVTQAPADVIPTTEAAPPSNRDFIVIATDAPSPPFTDFNEFGEVTGFAADFLRKVAEVSGLSYEIVVTPYQGVLANIASETNRDFDAVLPPQPIQETAVPGIVYTKPFLEIGQVVLVLANENSITGPQDLQPDMLIGVAKDSDSEYAAREILGIADSSLIRYDQPALAVQALAQEEVRAVIVNSYMADYMTSQYAQQFKVAGGNGRDAWITNQTYAIALPATSTDLLQTLNEAITQITADENLTQTAVSWFVDSTPIDAGESRVGTPTDEIIIGTTQPLVDLDPAGDPANPANLLSWEVKMNTMSGLYGYTADGQLTPVLAQRMPTITEDGLVYTIALRQDLRFPDGSAFTADDVKWSINRAARLGNFTVNSLLQDSNDDNFADAEAVEVVDTYTVRIRLQEANGAFIHYLATPPFFPVSDECFPDTLALTSTCGGLGAYLITEWQPGVQLRLAANPDWPGTPAPAFAKIQLRFYDDMASMQRSLVEFQSIDVAWQGVGYADFLALQTQDLDGDGRSDISGWTSPAIFKSYIIFDHDTAPWDKARVRQAAGLALDRQALAQIIFEGSRLPLLSPVPDGVPGQKNVFPDRNLAQARALLTQEGYSEGKPAEVILYYINDGRYSDREERYAEAIKAQLEETGIFKVTLQGTPWEVFRIQIAQCNYPAYLMGWPSPGRPVDVLDVSAWTDFFIENTTNIFCSNYENPRMTDLLNKSREESDLNGRAQILADMQDLWAVDVPTLDILQEPMWALSLDYVTGVSFNAFGLMNYSTLSKNQP